MVNCAMPSTVFNGCPFLEDFIETLISNGPYMIKKRKNLGIWNFGNSWFWKIHFSENIEEKEAFQAYPEQKIFYNSKMGLGLGLGNSEFMNFKFER